MIFRRLITFIIVLLSAVQVGAQLNTVRVMEIGRNALYFEDYVLSIQYFNRVIEAKPFLYEPYFYRGLAKFYLDDYVGAEADLTSAIERNPYVARNYQLRAMCRARLDSVLLAEKDIREAIKYDPYSSELWQNLGVLAMQAGEWGRAAEIVDTLLSYAPRSGNAAMLRTRIALNLNDSVVALDMANKAVELDKFSSEVYDNRSMVLYEQGEFLLAEQDLDRSIELMPSRSGSYINRALVRYYQNNLRGAMEDYDKALSVEPGSFVALYNRGLLRMNVGDDNRAIEDFDKVLEIDPDNTMARFNRGLLRVNVGDYSGAVADYTKVIEDYPNFEYAYQCRAEAFRALGDKKSAEKDEAWLLKRRLDIYNNGVESVTEEYSAESDKTRKRSDANIRNYNKMVVADDAYGKNYAVEYRGKIQNRNTFIEMEPAFALTFYGSVDDLGFSSVYNLLLENLNKALGGEYKLLLTNDERALSEGEALFHFGRIDKNSKVIAENPDDVNVLFLRAIDYSLVQDLESSLADLDRAAMLDNDMWALFFVRSLVRSKMLDFKEKDEKTPGVAGLKGADAAGFDYGLVKNDLDRVVALVPDFPFAYFNRANVFAKMSDYKSAIVDYTMAINLDDSFAEAYYNRGLARIYIGNTEEGVEDLSRAGELGLFNAYSVIKRFK